MTNSHEFRPQVGQEKQYDFYDPKNALERKKDLDGRLYTETRRGVDLDSLKYGESPDYFIERRGDQQIQWKVTVRDSGRTYAGGNVDHRTHFGMSSGNQSKEITRGTDGKFTNESGVLLDASKWTAVIAERHHLDDKE